MKKTKKKSKKAGQTRSEDNTSPKSQGSEQKSSDDLDFGGMNMGNFQKNLGCGS